MMTLVLTLAPAWFDRQTLASLPFTLFHECVSHILQGPWVAERPRPDRASQFAEGWMDRAAWEVFTTTLNRTVKLLPYPYRDSFYQDGGRKMCEARHNIDSNGSKHQMWAEANRRYEGWLAADLVLQALQDLKVAEPVPTSCGCRLGSMRRLSRRRGGTNSPAGSPTVFADVEYLWSRDGPSC